MASSFVFSWCMAVWLIKSFKFCTRKCEKQHYVIAIIDVDVTIGNPGFCLALDLTGVHFRGKLQDVGHVNEQKIKYWPIKTRKITGFKL